MVKDYFAASSSRHIERGTVSAPHSFTTGRTITREGHP